MTRPTGIRRLQIPALEIRLGAMRDDVMVAKVPFVMDMPQRIELILAERQNFEAISVSGCLNRIPVAIGVVADNHNRNSGTGRAEPGRTCFHQVRIMQRRYEANIPTVHRSTIFGKFHNRLYAVARNRRHGC